MDSREKAGEIVAKYGRYNADSPSAEHKYYVRYAGKLHFAADTNLLADKLAEVIEAEVAE